MERHMSTAISRRDPGLFVGAHRLFAGVAWCAMALWLGGCQGKPADQTTQSLNTFQHAVQQTTDARAQVGKTLTALDEYCKKPGLDTYNAFVSQIDEPQRQADGIRSTAVAMRDQHDAYFATWDAEL